MMSQSQSCSVLVFACRLVLVHEDMLAQWVNLLPVTFSTHINLGLELGFNVLIRIRIKFRKGEVS